jgi:cardiolipin synthase C
LKVINSDDRERSLRMGRELGAILAEAQSTLLMTSPYLVPGKAGMRWFQKVRDRGITVKIITNSLASTDSPVAEFGYIRYRKEFLRMGVELYELKPTGSRGGKTHSGIGGSRKGALHTKTIILDDRAVFVGSFNLDLRSARFDTQNGIFVYSPELAEQATGIFTKDASPTHSFRVTLTGDDFLVWVTAEKGHEVRYYREPMAGFWRCFSGRLFYMIIPESEL